jgi:hypothetical protein
VNGHLDSVGVPAAVLSSLSMCSPSFELVKNL